MVGGEEADSFAIFKSTDRGRSWTRSDDGVPGRSRINAFGMAEGLSFAGTDAGIFTSGDGALNWQPGTGLAMASDGRLVIAGAAEGIYFSKDSGRTWTRARQGLPEKSPGIAFLVTPHLILAGCPMRLAPGGP